MPITKYSENGGASWIKDPPCWPCCMQTHDHVVMLARELSKPASVRIVGSSIQFGGSYEPNGDETWAVFPHERARLVALIERTRAEGVLFISGDLHYGEVSRLEVPSRGAYPLYDVTSSGLTQKWPSVARNANRVGLAAGNNWGRLAVLLDPGHGEPRVEASVMGASGETLLGVNITLAELRFGA